MLVVVEVTRLQMKHNSEHAPQPLPLGNEILQNAVCLAEPHDIAILTPIPQSRFDDLNRHYAASLQCLAAQHVLDGLERERLVHEHLMRDGCTLHLA